VKADAVTNADDADSNEKSVGVFFGDASDPVREYDDMSYYKASAL
jgi:hypothetical protein